MVGLGPGARSYTRRLHYSTRYAVSQTAIRGIIDDFIQQDHGRIEHGLSLDPEEERRRFLILSLLDCGVDSIRYRARFNSELSDDFPELTQLVEAELARSDSGTLRLTDLGTDYSDTIGHWLFSPRVRGLMGSYLP